VHEIAKIGTFLGEEKKWSGGDFFRLIFSTLPYKFYKIETVKLDVYKIVLVM